jgi:copper chaperone CopZ
MKSLKKTVMAITLLLSVVVSNAQIKNAKTETVKVFGNCGMCETTIEKVGNLEKVAQVDWNKDTKMATLTYDAKKTNQDEILKHIALAGYDSEKFLAPDDVYNNLHGCCQYDREAKIAVKTETKSDPSDSEQAKQMATMENQNEHANHNAPTTPEKQEVNQLKAVFDNYFALKDALVKTDGKTASLQSKELLSAINAVKMETLKMDVHMVWMKVMNQLKEDAKHISETQDVKHQRDYFMTLSKNIYELLKVSKAEMPIYYQFCPMANGGKGANWLSKENTIKNPYYGSQMLSCGKTIETIK